MTPAAPPAPLWPAVRDAHDAALKCLRAAYNADYAARDQIEGSEGVHLWDHLEWAVGDASRHTSAVDGWHGPESAHRRAMKAAESRKEAFEDAVNSDPSRPQNLGRTIFPCSKDGTGALGWSFVEGELLYEGTLHVNGDGELWHPGPVMGDDGLLGERWWKPELWPAVAWRLAELPGLDRAGLEAEVEREYQDFRARLTQESRVEEMTRLCQERKQFIEEAQRDKRTGPTALCLERAVALAAELWAAWRWLLPADPPPEMPELLDAEAALGGIDDLLAALLRLRKAKTKRPKRRSRKDTPLTPRQSKVMEVVARHEGDLKAAAAELRISRQSVQRQYNAAGKKLGPGVMSALGPKKPKPKTQKIPTDKRGQTMLGREDPSPDLD